ncbi:MAG: signal recognition particle-docking protein FtsY [Acidiferrobacterales bacterium]
MTLSNKTAPSKTSSRGLIARLGERLSGTRQSLTQRLADLLLGAKTVDGDLLEELETILLAADVGVEATQTLITDITQRVARKELGDGTAVYGQLRQNMREILEPCAQALVISPGVRPFVLMIVGVNGVGKTTTIGKLAQRLLRAELKVMIAAADTYRAAAIEQLQMWGERAGVPVIAQHTGADAAAVAHDALFAARTRETDVLIVDTAGRQHTNVGLMDELRKIKRVLNRLDSGAPHEVLMIIDAVTGQNALSQLEHFHGAIGVTGLCTTKLDGTAKGGIMLALAQKTGLPIRYIGIGEGIDDLIEFNAEDFVDTLVPQKL